MSMRYEWIDASATEPALEAPGTRIGEHHAGGLALILGDPNGTALVIEGNRAELRVFADEVSRLLDEEERAAVPELQR